MAPIPWPAPVLQVNQEKDTKSDLPDLVAKADSEETDSAPSEQQVARPPEDKEVLTLDEGQLKALLDEAITYKNPKDREGKSELFKELLQEAEADESKNSGLGDPGSGKLPRGYYNNPPRRRHSRYQGRECGVGVSTTRGGSLQNLNALGMEGGRGGRSRRSGRSGETLVSARQREGGSLPTNVNVDDLDGIISPNYTSRATLEVTAPSREDLTVEDANHPLTLFQGHYVANGYEPLPILVGGSDYNNRPAIMNFTRDDSVDHRQSGAPMNAGPVESGAVLYPSSPMQHVSVLSIPPPPIHVGSDEHRISDGSHHKELKINQKVSKTAARSAPAVDVADIELATDGLLQLPFTTLWNRFSSFTLLDFRDPNARMMSFAKDSHDKAKSLDENGNALGCVRMDSNCLDRKKQRRVKTKNDRNSRDFLAEDVEGFRGGADIETLMEYIESPSGVLETSKNKNRANNQANGPRSHQNVKMRTKEEESKNLKRKAKEKLQRCNSLEEISKTKLEDLTEESSSERVNGSTGSLSKKAVTQDDVSLAKKSSWYNNAPSSSKKMKDRLDRTSQEAIQDSEFHLVTKKQRKRRKRVSYGDHVGSKPIFYGGRGFPAHDRTLEHDGASGLLYQYQHGHIRDSVTQSRRKSASSVPPSEKSDSSDLDSVHSLPVSSTMRSQLGKNAMENATPQASYADITRSVTMPQECQGNMCKQEKCLNSNPSIMLPNPTRTQPIKKDAMTDTNCDSLIFKAPFLEYPPLETRNIDSFTSFKVKSSFNAFKDSNSDNLSVKTVNEVIKSERRESVKATLPSVKPLPLKRPPVILLDEPSIVNYVINDVVFGFEINHQLLSCDQMCNSSEVATPSNVVNVTSSHQVPVEATPSAPRDPHHQRLVDFISAGWEKTMKDLQEGRARYYQQQ